MKLQIVCLVAAAAIIAGCKAPNYKEPISFNQLPAPVQATVRNEIGDGPIVKITQENKWGITSYRIETELKGPNGVIWVAPNGEILKESRSMVKEHEHMNEAAGAQAPISSPRQAP